MACRRNGGVAARWWGEILFFFFFFFFKPFDKLTRLWISSLAGRRWNNLQADLCVKRICRFSSFLYRLVGETADVDGQSNRPLIESLTKSGAVIKSSPPLQHTLLSFLLFFNFPSFFNFNSRRKKLTSCSLLWRPVGEGGRKFNHDFMSNFIS